METSRARTSACPCGSGIAFDVCCGGPLAHPSVQLRKSPQTAAELAAARAELKAGELQAAERRVRQLLAAVPNLLRGLDLLIQLRRAANDTVALAVLLPRRVALYPDYDLGRFELATFLVGQGKGSEAEAQLQKLLAHNPRHADAHNLLGQLTIQNLGTLQKAEYHLRQAYYLKPQVAFYSVKLAYALRLLARWEEAIHFLRIALALEPDNLDALQCWFSIEESRHNLDKAWQLHRVAMQRAPTQFRNRLNEALLQRRSRQGEAALSALDAVGDISRCSRYEQVAWYFERGHVLDSLGRYADAFDAFSHANRRVREDPARCYNVAANAEKVEHLKRYFTRDRLRRLPRGRPQRDNEEQPIFIVGFPRSGTSMLEQVLSSHPEISGGNELILAQRMTERAQGWLKSSQPYPYCLDDLALPQHVNALQRFRNYYLGELRTLAILDPGVRRFTDKMPLNELHLGMISLAFPEARIVHILRHPLDIILSCFCNELQHGDNFAYDLECAARHYVLMMDLVDHYCRELDIHYHRVRYEDMVTDLEGEARRVLDFIGVPWDPACLAFHQSRRAARTASYAQVTEQVHTRSVNRYHRYREQLQPIVPVLRETAARFGYVIDS
jgi:tetratricopeptide (TPR) repeat protein